MVDNEFRQQAHRQGGKEINSRMLLDEHGGQADEDHRHHNKGLPPDICPLFLGPHRGNADGVGHMERGAYACIGVKGVENTDTIRQEVIPGENCGPQILAAGEENVDRHGGELGDDDVGLKPFEAVHMI